MKDYPVEATERFDDAKFHRKYCMSFVKKFIHGNVLEVGAGCGSFTRDYIDNKMNATLTETDNKILYLHVLEHIEDDRKELKEVETKLNKGGHLIIMVPRHQKLYSNFDKSIGHFRRYEINFFEKNFYNLNRKLLKSLDSFGYLLYFLNKLFFKNEKFPSKFKIFIWDKIFTPLSIALDLITNYKIGKCIIAVYKK